VCLANQSSPDAQLAMSNYGLRQINADDGTEYAVLIESDFVVWQQGRSYMGEPATSIYGYNLTTNEIIPIEWEDYYHATLPLLEHGRVVYARLPEAGAPETGGKRLILWDKESRERTTLHTHLGGESLPYGFDGTWVAFRNRFSSNETENGLFGLNVDTGEVVPIYQVTPRGSGEKLVAESVSQGFLYYEIDVDRQGGGFDANLHEYDLTNHTDQVVAVIGGKSACCMVASDRYIVWEGGWASVQDTLIYAYDRVTKHVLQVTDPDFHDEGGSGEGGTFPSVGGDWVTFQHHKYGINPSSNDDIIAQNLLTGNRTTVVANDHTGSAQVSATDGKTVVVAFGRATAPFETIAHDLYWTTLPTSN
jgi:hypothetical protein